MAEKDDASLIGYDPLAWLQHSDTVSSATESNQRKNDDSPIESDAEGGAFLDATSAATAIEDEADAFVEAITTFEMPVASVERAIHADAVAECDASIEEPSSELRTADTGNRLAGSVILDAVQNIQTVASLHACLVSELAENDYIEIDASSVSQIDTSTLQLLLVLKRTAIKQNKEVSIDFPSERFIEAANLLGLTEILNVDHAPAGFF